MDWRAHSRVVKEVLFDAILVIGMLAAILCILALGAGLLIQIIKFSQTICR